MSDLPPITRPMRRRKIAQDAPGTIFSRGVAPQVSPVSTPRNLEDGFRASTLFDKFGRWKTVWTLPSLWTHRTRPQRLGKPHRPRLPTAPTHDRFAKRERETNAPHTKTLTLPALKPPRPCTQTNHRTVWSNQEEERDPFVLCFFVALCQQFPPSISVSVPSVLLRSRSLRPLRYPL
jgi:hypothetical protein